MRLVFCGTPDFAVPTLHALVAAGHEVALALSQPDRPRGRGLEVVPTPVRLAAQAHRIRVLQPEKIKHNQELRAELAAIAPQAIVVVAYGRILPAWMIELPALGNLNAHASLLPKYRGAAPIQWAIAGGESVTGVTTMRIDAGLDTGDMLLHRELPIEPHDTAVTLSPKLAQLGAELMVETLRGLEAGTLQPVPQDHAQATLAPLLKKEDGLMDFRRTAQVLSDRLRGFQPWPGAFTTFHGNVLNVSEAAAVPGRPAKGVGGELEVTGGRILVACGGGTSLELLEVQPQGKRRMAAREFLNGYQPVSGEVLGA